MFMKKQCTHNYSIETMYIYNVTLYVYMFLNER